MTNRQGYWSGMPGNMKLRAVFWALYYIVSAVIFVKQPILGALLLVVPAFWCLFWNWLRAEMSFKTDIERGDTLLGYTLGHILNQFSATTRMVLGSVFSIAVLAGLVWVSTEDMRQPPEKPSISERVSGAVDVTKEKTGGWIDGAKETTGGWVASAKGWFKSDEDE